MNDEIKNTLDLIEKRLYEDKFYVQMFSSALNYCKELVAYGKNSITFVCVRGSLVTSRITPEEDIDIVVNAKKMKKLEKYSEKLSASYDSYLKSKIPQLLRQKIFSVYIPKTPTNPYKRHDLFLEDPADLEIRTTQAEQPMSLEKQRVVYRFQRRELATVVRKTLANKEEDSIGMIDMVRQIAMAKYGMDRDTAHNCTIISQARLAGMIFSRERISKNSIVEKRDRIVEEVFNEEISEIKHKLGV